MRVLVYGAGAVGATVGGMLSLAGHEVVLLGRDPFMHNVRAGGLQISGIWGEHHVHPARAQTEYPDDFDPEFVLLTVKAYHTVDAGGVLAGRLPAACPVLHLQNGVGNAEILAGFLGAESLATGMVIIGFALDPAGATRVTVQADSIKVGSLLGRSTPAVSLAVRLLYDAGLPVEEVADIQAHLWGKVLYNAALNPLGAILGVAYGALREAHAWAIIEQIVAEAFAVLQPAGIRVPWESADAYLAHLRDRQIPSTAAHEPSMHADQRAGRPTEVDAINGAICRLGPQQGVATPANDTLVRLLHAREALPVGA